jgi:glycosyltransferase involved in cell wall biosynthesis
MRIAYLTHYAELYGANRSLFDLLVGLRQQGIEAHVLLAEAGPFAALLERNGIPHAITPFATWMHKRHYSGGPHHRLGQWLRQRSAGRARDRRNEENLPALVKACKAWGIQGVHTNSGAIGIGLDLAKALAVPHVWHLRELHKLHYGYEVDGGDRRWRRALRESDAVIAISEAVRKAVDPDLGQAGQAVRIYDGVFTLQQLGALEPSIHLRWTDEVPFTFIQAGLFHASKGQLESLEAFARIHAQYPATRLILAGGGRDEAVRARIAELGLERAVELPGFVEDVMPLFLQAHCVLNPSRHEAFGRTTVEGMAAGIPVIGHASGATTELITPGVTGDLYPGGVVPLVECMERWVRDPVGARAAGLRGRAEVQARFTVEQCAQEVMAVYQGIRSKKG